MGTGPEQTPRRTERRERPAAEWVRGECPRCGEALVARSYYVAGEGYLVLWECWGAQGSDPECDYRRVL